APDPAAGGGERAGGAGRGRADERLERLAPGRGGDLRGAAGAGRGGLGRLPLRGAGALRRRPDRGAVDLAGGPGAGRSAPGRGARAVSETYGGLIRWSPTARPGTLRRFDARFWSVDFTIDPPVAAAVVSDGPDKLTVQAIARQ